MRSSFPYLIVVTGLLTALATMSVCAQEPIAPIEPPAEIHMAKSALGKMLYFDPRLSKSGYLSCNSCHNLAMGGTDNLTTSIGHGWQQGPINSPTVLNSSLNLAQFWDGRAADLKEQAGGPIANPKEMASSHALAIDVLKSIPDYVTQFRLTFGDATINIDRVTDAIAEFEKTLVTPGSRFDQWLLGDADALTDNELAGYQLFKLSGCVACHNGAAVGGNTYQKMGLVAPYQTDNPSTGRFAVTGKDADRFMFKVPTLRNVELTYPYFHDGAAKTLSDAVDTMGKIQLGKAFSEPGNEQIVAFLKTLTGVLPEVTLPQLPPSAADTPQPQPFE